MYEWIRDGKSHKSSHTHEPNDPNKRNSIYDNATAKAKHNKHAKTGKEKKPYDGTETQMRERAKESLKITETTNAKAVAPTPTASATDQRMKNEFLLWKSSETVVRLVSIRSPHLA